MTLMRVKALELVVSHSAVATDGCCKLSRLMQGASLRSRGSEVCLPQRCVVGQARRQHFRACHAPSRMHRVCEAEGWLRGWQETSPNLRGPDIYLNPRSGERPAAQPQAADSAPGSSGNACADRIVVDTAHLPRACTLLQARHKQ